MHKAGLRPYVIQRKPISTERIRAARREFAHQQMGVSQHRLNRWIFSDEASVGRAAHAYNYIWRKKGTPLFEGRQLSVAAQDPVKVNIWAAISHTGFLCFRLYEERMTGALYCTAMEEDLLPALHERFGAMGHSCLVQDKARYHTARVVKELFATEAWKKVKVLDFPPYSPDLNLIENTWTRLARVVDDLEPRNRSDLLIALHIAIDRINSQERKTHYFRNLYKSFPVRCQEVIRAKGFPTKF